MKGDFARFTFDPTLHYSQVLQQQGRVLLEADWNEQGRIQLHLLRTLIGDLVGPCWAVGDGFKLSFNGDSSQLANWTLSKGHFYVDGILCVNESDCLLTSQPNAPTPDYGTSDNSSGFTNLKQPFALYLDVWERHLCAIEAPGIADVALDGIDTCSRAQVVWQVRVFDQALAAQWLGDITTALDARKSVTANDDAKATTPGKIDPVATLQSRVDSVGNAAGTGNPNDASCTVISDVLAARATYALPGLSAKLGQAPADSDPCAIAADARYRGCENQLYRVEIHHGGLAGTAAAPGTASFKWSRENGSVVFPILLPADKESINVDGSGPQVLALAGLGRDARLGLAANDWVELVDDDYTLAQRTHALRQVIDIDPATCEVTLAALGGGASDSYPLSARKHPMLRRWDHGVDANAPGVLAVAEGTAITLEDNIQITFAPGGLYATGDYWLIPARVAGSGMLYWPTDASGNPASLPPRGLHHYAVLGVNGDGSFQTCGCRFDSLCALIQASRQSQPGVAGNIAVPAPQASQAATSKAAVTRAKKGGG